MSNRPSLESREVLQKYCPGLPDRTYADSFFRIYQQIGLRAVQLLISSGRFPDFRALGAVSMNLRKSLQLWEDEIVIREAIDRYPMIDHIYHDLGLLYAAQGRHVAARRYFATALNLQPAYWEFYSDFGITMMALGNLEAARFLLVRSILLNFEAHQPWLNLASVCAGWRPEKSDAIKVDRNLGGATNLPGQLDIDLANLHDAKICLRRVLHLKPNHSTAESMMAWISEITEDHTEGPPTNQELGSVLHLGECELGASTTDGPKWTQQTVKAFKRSTVCRYRGDLAGAFSEIREAERFQPDDIDILRTKAMLLRDLGRLEEAMRVFEVALLKRPSDRQLLLNYAGTLTRLGMHEKAVRAAQTAIQTDPIRPCSWLTLAKAYSGWGKRSEARDVLMQAARLCPPYSWSLISGADLYQELQVFDPLTWWPSSDKGDLGSTSSSRQRDGELDEYESSTNVSHPTVGPGSVSERKFDSEVQKSRPPIKDKTRFQELRQGAFLALANGNVVEALRLAEEAIQMEPLRAHPWEIKARALAVLGRVTEALQALERAIDIDPSDPAKWDVKATFLQKLGHFHEASLCVQHAKRLQQPSSTV